MRDDGVIRVGVLGCGHVGSALVRLIGEHAERIEQHTGVQLEVTRVAVRNLSRERDVALPSDRFTHDAEAVVTDPDIDLVVEVIGGIEPARGLIAAALEKGKPVVTANKELLANVGKDLFEVAASNGVDLLFEASVAGGIPIVRPLRESLAGDRISRVMGIVNGTTNYILSEMAERGSTFQAALADAQTLGYAERDPTADVEGFDAAAKAAILASLAFNAQVVAGDVYREGIVEITDTDIAAAQSLGYVVKLLAIAEAVDDGEGGTAIAVRVHPAMVPQRHVLAQVNGSFNALFVEAQAAGDLMFYGRGAGGEPTASAVLGDVVDAATNLAHNRRGATVGPFARRPIRPIDEVESEFYVMMDVHDRPGVLAKIADCFGRHNVSIRSMRQAGLGNDAQITFITHLAREADFRATIREIGELEIVDRVGSVLRVVGSE